MIRKFVIVGAAVFVALMLMSTVALTSGAPRTPPPTATSATSELAPAKTEDTRSLDTEASLALVLALGVFAAAMIAGARTATRGR